MDQEDISRTVFGVDHMEEPQQIKMAIIHKGGDL